MQLHIELNITYIRDLDINHNSLNFPVTDFKLIVDHSKQIYLWNIFKIEHEMYINAKIEDLFPKRLIFIMLQIPVWSHMELHTDDCTIELGRTSDKQQVRAL